MNRVHFKLLLVDCTFIFIEMLQLKKILPLYFEKKNVMALTWFVWSSKSFSHNEKKKIIQAEKVKPGNK